MAGRTRITASANRRGDGQNDDKVYARARGSAQNVDFEGGDFQRLENVTMTTCAEGNDDVLLSAREIELDHVAGVGTAKSMTVKFKQIPIFYFPIATFPINDQRKTGFLFPAAGYDNESGVMVEAPYYINIAPQYDATVTPRVLSNRGAQLFGEFRYLGENGRGALRGEFLPSDDAYKTQMAKTPTATPSNTITATDSATAGAPRWTGRPSPTATTCATLPTRLPTRLM